MSDRPMELKQRFIFTLLYFSEGCPIGFIWWAVPTWLRTEGVEVGAIATITAMLVLPWTFKFLWAPAIDACRSRRIGYRAWITGAQLLMGITLLPVFWIDPASQLNRLFLCLMLHAICAATQDVAIDALAIRSIAPHSRGTLNGWMQAGMLVGRSLFGGGAILIITQWGVGWLMAGLLLGIWSTTILVWLMPEPEDSDQGKLLLRHLGRRLAEACRGKRFWLGLGFALIGAAGFELAGALAGPFLIDHGVAEETVGWLYGIPIVLATVAGGLLGGRLSDRLGRIRSVAIFLACFVGMVLTLGILDWAGNAAVPQMAWVALFTGLYFCIGLFVAASYALFMDLTDPKLSGTQFSTYMAATNGCESWSVFAGGRIIDKAGYGPGFLLMGIVSLASLLLLKTLHAIQSGKTGEREESRRAN